MSETLLRDVDAELAAAERLIRLATAALVLGVAPKTIRKYCKCGLLRCQKLPGGQWRVYESSLRAARGDRPNVS
jgi:predicted site-specific integrase-resolvase